MKKEAQIDIVFTEQGRKQQQMPGVAADRQRQADQRWRSSPTSASRGTASEVLDGEINRKMLHAGAEPSKKVVVGEPGHRRRSGPGRRCVWLRQTKDGKPDVEQWLKRSPEQAGATVDLYVRDAVWPSVALKKLVGGKVAITDEDLQKGFESNYGERVEVLAIVLSDQRQARRSGRWPATTRPTPFFAELAEQYSIEPASRSNGGKVPPIRRYGGSPMIEEEAFKLKPGELSGIVAVDGQFIILRCLGRTKPVQIDFNRCEASCTSRTSRRRSSASQMTKEFDRLRKMAQIDNFLAGTSQSGKMLRPAGKLEPIGATGPAARDR